MAQPFFMEVPCSLLTNSDVLCCLFDIYNKANTIHLSTAFYVRDYIGSFFFFFSLSLTTVLGQITKPLPHIISQTYIAPA